MTAKNSPASPSKEVTVGNRVLILGAGYAGLRCAQAVSKYLTDPGAPEIMLVDRNSYHQIITQLPETVSGRLSTDEVAVPYSELLERTPVRFLRAEVRNIDLDHRQAVTSEGALTYTTLIVALGSVTAYYGVPGLREHALTLKSVEDAEEITRRVHRAMAAAAGEADSARRARLLSFLIGGAGLTGVELAGELAEVLPIMGRAHGIPATEPRVTLIEAAPSVLPSMPDRLQGKAAAILAELGVRLVLGTKVILATQDGVDLASGDRLVGST
ncbi:MAG: NAD(P)/FAD-dependent oxidoreductase, partial [Chloroflexota bacterium]